MPQINSMHPCLLEEVNFAVLKYGSIDDFLKSDEHELILEWLAFKMLLYRNAEHDTDNLTKLFQYYLLAIAQPFEAASNKVKEEVKATKHLLQKYVATHENKEAG